MFKLNWLLFLIKIYKQLMNSKILNIVEKYFEIFHGNKNSTISKDRVYPFTISKINKQILPILFFYSTAVFFWRRKSIIRCVTKKKFFRVVNFLVGSHLF